MTICMCTYMVACNKWHCNARLWHFGRKWCDFRMAGNRDT